MNGNPFKTSMDHDDYPTKEGSFAWLTGIGLQEVDGLKVSPFLMNLAKDNIEGKIGLEEVGELIEEHYGNNTSSDRQEEADLVAQRIASILLEKDFDFSTYQILQIHGKLFEGLYPHAGKIRTYNISKNEWILGGKSVFYSSYQDILPALQYDLSTEKGFIYQGLSKEETITHLSRFLADIWQIHPFGEGNTRTMAVFFIKYIRTLGFSPLSDAFLHGSSYFRNALVRANYRDLSKGIDESTEYLSLFLKNLILNEEHPLDNLSLQLPN